jgi:hypothetical protein
MRQPELIPSTEMPAALFDVQESQGQYTAARLFEQKPEVAQQIIGMLAEGIGILRISRICRVSPSTVIAVRDRSGVEIENQGRAVSRTAMHVAHQSLEAVQEAIDDPDRRQKVSPRDWAIIAGVAVDKAQLLAGLPTSISVNVAAELPSHDDYERMVSEMGRGGDAGGQKADGSDRSAGSPGDQAAVGIGGQAPGPAAAGVVDLQEVDGVFQDQKEGNQDD